MHIMYVRIKYSDPAKSEKYPVADNTHRSTNPTLVELSR